MTTRENLPAELGMPQPDQLEHASVLSRIPEPWRARLTGRRFRRWRHASRAITAYNATLPATAPVLNFFPMRPQPRAPIMEMVRILGLRVGFSPRADEATIAWDGDTWFSPRAARRLPSNAINGRCLDISKSRVQRIWHEVAGRSLVVDPRTFRGNIVVKPEENGRHGGQVVRGPLEHTRRGKTYERLIDTTVGEYVTQTRPVIIDGQIVLAYEKWRPASNRFFGTTLSLPRTADELYSVDEQDELIRFARAIEMDYGELDVLRDREDGCIHVVDANRTPSRPWALAERHQLYAWQVQAAALDALIRSRF
ncbi:MAG TPA: hypothetical protein VH371_02915 [Candidatus Limnocylindrales bacterium]